MMLLVQVTLAPDPRISSLRRALANSSPRSGSLFANMLLWMLSQVFITSGWDSYEGCSEVAFLQFHKM